MSRYKATVVIEGCWPQHLYGANLARVKEQAVKRLTASEPGFGSTWPVEVVVYGHVRTLSGNQAQWAEIERVQFKDVPEDKQEWKRKRAQRLAKSQVA